MRIPGRRQLLIASFRTVIAVCLAAESDLVASARTVQDKRTQTQPQAAAPTVRRVALRSEFLERAEYDGKALSLTLYFDDGSVYRYAGVPANVFDRLSQAGNDAGSFFNKSIRNRFRYRRLTPARKQTPSRVKPLPRPVEIACPPLKGMRKQDVKSVALKSVYYDSPTRCLVLDFVRDHVYRYGNVPEAVYRRLLQSSPPDPVRYFNASIRNKYRSQRLR